MPRPRNKARVEHVADAHASLLKAQHSLREIDLRTTSGPLREAVRACREQTAEALDAAYEALRLDVPKRPH